MAKMTLAMKRSDIHKQIEVIPAVYDVNNGPTNIVGPFPVNFFSIPVELLDRAVCEKQPEYLQLIPYVTMFDPTDGTFFVYTRGAAGNENRLHGKCSVGIGGHPESLPGFGIPLQQTLSEAMVRELEEETGAVLTDAEIASIDNFEQNALLLYSDRDDVGSVHIGISVILSIDKNRVSEAEENIITKGRWITLNGIIDGLNNEEFDLENWSKIFVFEMIRCVEDAKQTTEPLDQLEQLVAQIN